MRVDERRVMSGIVQAGGSIKVDAMFPERMLEITDTAAKHTLKPRITPRVQGIFNPEILSNVAAVGQGCVTFIFPREP